MPICTSCGEDKPITSYRVMKKKRRKHNQVIGEYDYVNPKCRDCENAANKARYNEGGKEAWKHTRQLWEYKYRFNLTKEDYEALYAECEGKCPICTTDLVPFGFDTCVDHCHDTDKVRGLLCRQCNAGIGSLREDLDNLERAKDYLIKHKND